jgi:hypothetical protein
MPQVDRSAAFTPRFSGRDLRATLDTLHAIGEGCAGSADFARRGVEHLPRFVGSDLTTLVVCDLEKGHRTVVPSGMVSRRDIEVFDRYFRGRPANSAARRSTTTTTARSGSSTCWRSRFTSTAGSW